MRCPACGRVMLKAEALLICPNLLCDYSEEIGNKEARVSEQSWDSLSPLLAWALKE